ncbi:uncharacterized protein [Ptychodera flava]|uniref:uncharacterized protein n=1 Tax=Ptychodera flava TaxID=63121 RepID=UPI00396A95DD
MADAEPSQVCSSSCDVPVHVDDCVASCSTTRKRGPYKKYLTTKPAVFTSENVFEITLNEQLPTSDLCQEKKTPNRTDEVKETGKVASTKESDELESPCSIDSYTPPVNDEQDNFINDLFNELHNTALRENDTLRHESAQTTTVLDSVAEFVYNTTEFQENTEIHADVNDDEATIYEGSRRLLGVTVLLLCCFMIRFRLSDEAMSYLLPLLGLLLPEDSKVPKSLYGIRQFLKKHISFPEIRYYCAHCYTHVDSNSKTCSNRHCLTDLTKPGAMAYFVLHSCISQIRTMFKRKSFANHVRSHRFDHYAKSDDHIKDVYDGQNYKSLFRKGFLSNENNLSFAMNTDGVAIFKSSRVSMWPVYLMINELPIQEEKQEKI